jgi:hypothetical protein
MITLSLSNGHNESLSSEGRELKMRGKYFLIYFKFSVNDPKDFCSGGEP